MKKVLFALSASMLGLFVFVNPVSAATNLVTNGGFELPDITSAYLQVNAVDSTTIPGWTVSNGSVDMIDGYWTSYEGQQSVDMSGNTAGTLTQALTTVPGAKYHLTFWLAGNMDGGATVKTLNVSAGDLDETVTFDTAGHSKSAMGWTEESFDFTATDTSTALTFTSLDNSWQGAALDDVSVTQVLPDTKDSCKKDGWMDFGVFKNQGDCVSYVATKGLNLPAGQ